MKFLESLYPLFRLAFLLLIILLFLFGLAFVIDKTVKWLLHTLKETLKLEIRDPIGNFCLVVVAILAALFVFFSVSHDAFTFASRILSQEIATESLNLNMFSIVISLTFLGNLAVLGLLKIRR